jgi:HSP20 family protein
MPRIPWTNKEVGQSMPSLANLRGEMDRLFENFVREPFGLEWPFGQRGYAPAVDLGETSDEVVIRAEIPGIDPNDLEVTVAGGQLTLAGEKKDVAATTGRDFYHTESRSGRFRRTIPLTQAVDPGQVEAEYANGVLTIRLKKVPAVAPKRIDVKVREGEPPGEPSPSEPPPDVSVSGEEG